MKFCFWHYGFCFAGLLSVALSLWNWYIGDDKMLGLFTGLWAPTLIALAIYFKLNQHPECEEED